MYIVHVELIAIRLLAIERPIFRAISGISTPPRVIFRRNQAIFRKNSQLFLEGVAVFLVLFLVQYLFLAP